MSRFWKTPEDGARYDALIRGMTDRREMPESRWQGGRTYETVREHADGLGVTWGTPLSARAYEEQLKASPSDFSPSDEAQRARWADRHESVWED